jgi:pyrroloquinoline quinone biosynthesis protein E
MIEATDQPGLKAGTRLVHDPVRDRPALLYPEGVLLVNETAAAILNQCDGQRRVATIASRLAGEYAGMRSADVYGLLADLAGRRLLVLDGSGSPASQVSAGPSTLPFQSRAPMPLGMLAELTYRCPLHCTYCANPVNLSDFREELTTVDWRRLLDEARELGVLQAHFSGGEPMLRPDLAEIVAHAHQVGMYTNLVTSGIPSSPDDLAALAEAGLDHVQLSIQDSGTATADAIAGRPAHSRKMAVAGDVTGLSLPLTVNVVLHRANVEHVMELADLAVAMGADRVELAHTQFYGWAWRNRTSLMPTREQVAIANEAAARARQRYGDRIEFVYVDADYYATTPKPCMNGWGSRQLVVAPNGDVLPCLAAAQRPDLAAANTRDHSLGWIWHDSPAFNRFRGTDWMPDPCQGCVLKGVDFGGCRCQAFQITGDAAATDPACVLSPMHHLMSELTAAPAALATPRRAK